MVTWQQGVYFDVFISGLQCFPLHLKGRVYFGVRSSEEKGNRIFILPYRLVFFYILVFNVWFI